MEPLSLASANIKAAREADDCEIDALIARLDLEENRLKERQNELDQKKSDASDGLEVAGDDVIKINAGGQIITAERSVLTQLKGTRFEALFSGRWDKKLLRDGEGHIFLDVNPVAFRAIVDYLQQLAISSEEDPPASPRVNDEHQSILHRLLELFGLRDLIVPESKTIASVEEAKCLHEWLEEDGVDGEFALLFRGSKDGFDAEAFHSKCDSKGPTLTIVQTEGFTCGGYASTSWESTRSLTPVQVDKSFLFALSGLDIDSPCKMAMRDTTIGHAAICRGPGGPIFGGSSGFGVSLPDLKVNLGHGLFDTQCVSTNFGNTYEDAPLGLMSKGDANLTSTPFRIKEIEVYQVISLTDAAPKTEQMKTPAAPSSMAAPAATAGTAPMAAGENVGSTAGGKYEPGSSPADDALARRRAQLRRLQQRRRDRLALARSRLGGANATATNITSQSVRNVALLPVSKFSDGVNSAINAKQELLLKTELNIIEQEDSFEDERVFVSTFAGDIRDIVKLDVSGFSMTTKRSTLQTIEDSLLAQQFPSDFEVTEQERKRPEEWTPGDVAAWIEKIEGIPSETAIVFEEGEITGRELLALSMEGLEKLGIERTGTQCLLVKEIQALEKEVVTHIGLSSYYFGKILDFLRFKKLHSQGLTKEPDLPPVRRDEKNEFERAVRHYFPGESSKIILG